MCGFCISRWLAICSIFHKIYLKNDVFTVRTFYECIKMGWLLPFDEGVNKKGLLELTKSIAHHSYNLKFLSSHFLPLVVPQRRFFFKRRVFFDFVRTHTPYKKAMWAARIWKLCAPICVQHACDGMYSTYVLHTCHGTYDWCFHVVPILYAYWARMLLISFIHAAYLPFECQY